MKTIDLNDAWKELYTASEAHVREVAAERGVFLCIEGCGDPGGKPFRQASEQLYAVANHVRAQLRKAGRLSFKGPKLELRWMRGPWEEPKTEWTWRLLMRLPDEFTQADFREARKAFPRQGNRAASAVKRLSWRPGRALQILHVGRQADTKQSYAELRARADEMGYRLRGPGHEIYLADPRRTAPDRLRRIVRLPISRPRPPYAGGKSAEASSE
jgi:hypothetical protein